MSFYIDVHVLQSVPPSCINRDDTGSPKSAVYGGVRRARVSSQAWKRATREHFRRTLRQEDLGVRTKEVVVLLAQEITKQAPELETQSVPLAEKVYALVGVKTAVPKKSTEGAAPVAGYLFFLGQRQVENLARQAVASQRQGVALEKKSVKEAFMSEHSIDIALFGRMVADAADFNVDASTQVAHALSVHAVDTEFDYFTAVDDRAPADNAGSAMIGTVEFNSSTLYRYATMNMDALQDNLGAGPVAHEAAGRAAAAFLQSFVRSMPTGKQNTFANRTLPDAVLVQIRTEQPVNLVGAFETPITTDAPSGRSVLAAQNLARYAQEINQAYGDDVTHSYYVATDAEAAAALEPLGERVALQDLVDKVVTAYQEQAVGSA